LFCKHIKNHDIHIIIFRSFNYTGPKLRDIFAVPRLANQIVTVERNQQFMIKLGNLETIWEFSDVKDIVRVYYALILHGVSREIY